MVQVKRMSWVVLELLRDDNNHHELLLVGVVEMWMVHKVVVAHCQ